jgi:hypothetical protein
MVGSNSQGFAATRKPHASAPVTPPTRGPTTGTQAYPQSDPPLARNRQQRMRQTRPQITGRVDGIPRRTAEGESQGPDDHADQARREGAIPPRVRLQVLRRGDRENPEHQNRGADGFAEEIRRRPPNRRRGAEDRQLRRPILGHPPMRQVGQPNQHRPQHSAQHLRQHVPRHERPGKLPDGRQPDGHRRVQMRAAEGVDAVHRHRHPERPPRRHHDPTSPVPLRLLQHHVRDDTVAE